MAKLKKVKTVIIFALLASILLAGVCAAGVKFPLVPDGTQNDAGDERDVRALVEAFGKKLQNVSLLAPADVLKKSIVENYGGFVTPSLLRKWLENPQSAPGRQVSSPWPDRIEITEIEKAGKHHYRVRGEVIEITSAEQEKGGAAARRPITIEVQRVKERWFISGVTLGEYKKR